MPLLAKLREAEAAQAEAAQAEAAPQTIHSFSSPAAPVNQEVDKSSARPLEPAPAPAELKDDNQSETSPDVAATDAQASAEADKTFGVYLAKLQTSLGPFLGPHPEALKVLENMGVPGLLNKYGITKGALSRFQGNATDLLRELVLKEARGVDGFLKAEHVNFKRYHAV